MGRRSPVWLAFAVVIAACSASEPSPASSASSAPTTVFDTLTVEAGGEPATTSPSVPETTATTDAPPSSVDQYKVPPQTFSCGGIHDLPRKPLPLRDNKLIWAVSEGDLAEVERLLDAGADLNEVNSEYVETPLLMAAMWNCTDIAMVLLEEGADPNLVPEGGWSALVQAGRSDNLELLAALLEEGADPNLPSLEGTTPLLEATSVEALQLLIGAGADVTQEDLYEISPIESAAVNGWTVGVQTLLQAGASEIDALAAAIEWQQVDMVRFMFESGVLDSRSQPTVLIDGEEVSLVEWAKAIQEERTYRDADALAEIIRFLTELGQ